jgi:hypothetical protein
LPSNDDALAVDDARGQVQPRIIRLCAQATCLSNGVFDARARRQIIRAGLRDFANHLHTHRRRCRSRRRRRAGGPRRSEQQLVADQPDRRDAQPDAKPAEAFGIQAGA